MESYGFLFLRRLSLSLSPVVRLNQNIRCLMFKNDFSSLSVKFLNLKSNGSFRKSIDCNLLNKTNRKNNLRILSSFTTTKAVSAQSSNEKITTADSNNNSSTSSTNSKSKDEQFASKSRIIKKKAKRASPASLSMPSFKVKAYTTADYYDLESLKVALINSGAYEIHEIAKEIPESCLCVKAKYQILNEIEPRHMFFFEDGAVVFWNVSVEEQSSILEILKKNSGKNYPLDIVNEESENMSFSRLAPLFNNPSQAGQSESDKSEQASSDKSLQGESTHLNFTRLVNNHIYFQHLNTLSKLNSDHQTHMLEKYAFSDAIALSVKLGIKERRLERFTETIEHISDDLRRGQKLKLKIDDVLQRLGVLFTMRHMVNLNSNFLDTPDFYWDRENLENLYSQLYYHLSIAKRTRLFNEKLNHCIDLMQILKQHLTDKKHTRLEWIIIGLIAIEVMTALGFLDFLKSLVLSIVIFLKELI